MSTISAFAEARPAPPTAAAHADLGPWFEAPTASGALKLWVPAPPGATRHAADAALALARCDGLLDALDEWSGSALDWRFAPALPARPSGATHAEVAWCDPACRLFAPWAWLRQRPAPADALAARLQGTVVDAVLAIATMRLADDELALLEPGGAVLLSPSMRPSWRGHLRAAAEPAGAGLAMDLSRPWAPRLMAGGAGDEPPADDGDGVGRSVEVRLDVAPLTVDRLCGWRDDLLADPGAGASLWRCADRRAPAVRLAAGRLVPWGDGWALVIDAVDDDDDTVLWGREKI